MRVLAIGGFDPSGRAGILADVETIRGQGAFALAVVTTITAQGKRPRAEPVDAKLIAKQLEAARDSGPIDAVKIGVIPDPRVLGVVAELVADLGVPTVVDPVTVSSKGLVLSSLQPADFIALARKFVVLTPNRQEAGALQRLRGFGAIVVKSFSPGVDALFLAGNERPIWLKAKPLARTSLHRGTGCRFASAMAVDLSKGHTPAHAARVAKRVVRKFLSTPILLQLRRAESRSP